MSLNIFTVNMFTNEILYVISYCFQVYFFNREQNNSVVIRSIREIMFKLTCKELWMKLIWSFLFCQSALLCGAPTSIFHFFYLSIRPPICCTPYIRDHTSSNHDLWYNCVKWWYLQEFFLIFWNFYFLGC